MKTRLIVATSLVVVGLILFAVVMAEYNWDFTRLNTGNFETNTYEIREEFKDISMNTDTADITFALSDDGKCRIECYEEEKAKHSVTVQEGILVIELISNKSWYDYIGIHFGGPKIKVFLPESEYTSLSIREDTGDIDMPKDFQFADVDISLSTGDVNFFASAAKSLKLRTSTGKICVENASAGTLELSASTGAITVSNVTCSDANIKVTTGKTKLTDLACKNLTSSGDTGDVSLTHVIAAEKLTIERSTGDVKFDRSDAAEIFVETDTGDVTGSLLTDKIFTAKTDTGRADVPKTVTGGRCEITTDTGNIKITVP